MCENYTFNYRYSLSRGSENREQRRNNHEILPVFRIAEIQKQKNSLCFRTPESGGNQALPGKYRNVSGPLRGYQMISNGFWGVLVGFNVLGALMNALGQLRVCWGISKGARQDLFFRRL